MQTVKLIIICQNRVALTEFSLNNLLMLIGLESETGNASDERYVVAMSWKKNGENVVSLLGERKSVTLAESNK